MKKNKYKKTTLFFILILMLVVNITTVNAKTVFDKAQTEQYLETIATYEMEKIKSPAFGQSGGEWLVMGLSRYGVITEQYKSVYKNNLKNKLKECDGILSTRKYTEYSRVIIALTAMGENPENFAGYNLIQPLAELDYVTLSGASSVMYALIALDCGNYHIPEPKSSYSGTKTTRDKLIRLILDSQLEDGGWALTGKNADADVTAMALQALTAHQKEDGVKKAVNSGLNCLSKLQESDGSFSSGGRSNCESTAQVMVALSGLKIKADDERFVKNEKTVLDGLMKFYSNGGFRHTEGTLVNQMATEQGMYALTAYYRNICGMNRLYDMSEGFIKRELKKTEKTTNSIPEKNNQKSSEKKTKNQSTSNKKVVESITGKNGEIIQNEVVENSSNNEEVSTKKENSKINKEKKGDEEIQVTQVGQEIDETSDGLETTEGTKSENEKESSGKKNFIWGILLVLILCGTGVVLFLKKKKTKILSLFLIFTLCIGFTGCGKKNGAEVVGSCTIMVECSKVFDNMDKLDKAVKDYIPKDGMILEKREAQIYKGESVFDVLQRELKDENILMEASFTGKSAYIEGINNLYEFSCGKLSGWEYCVNGEYPNVACSEYKVKDGDVIEWHYSCDLGEDLKN